MHLRETVCTIPYSHDNRGFIKHFSCLQNSLDSQTSLIRFAVMATESQVYTCELGLLAGNERGSQIPNDLFHFKQRTSENVDTFNAVLIVPTGIGAEIGGHAGDATPVARLVAESCDTLVTHPNVVNASDINEMPENTLYVEGSILTRMLMGTIGLQKVRSNRILVLIGDHPDKFFQNAAVNAVSAARATLGIDCAGIVELGSSFAMRAHYSKSGRACGEVEDFEQICHILEDQKSNYDAVAIATIVDVPEEYHRKYFQAGGEMINPWGGSEALLTHAISSIYDIPSAHAPMLEDRGLIVEDMGDVEPRLAAEAISLAFLHCVLKGLHRSPKIVTEQDAMCHSDTLTVRNISCVIVPSGCLGLPTLAALEQDIPVIEVSANKNLANNDLSSLPWKSGKYFRVENYLEAVGVMNALKAGIEVGTIARPIEKTLDINENATFAQNLSYTSK